MLLFCLLHILHCAPTYSVLKLFMGLGTNGTRCCDWETAMKRADEYMYRQKSEHKHCCV